MAYYDGLTLEKPAQKLEPWWKGMFAKTFLLLYGAIAVGSAACL